MLTGVKIISGFIYVKGENETHDEDTMFAAMEILESVIGANFNHNSHNNTSRFGSDYCESWEPVMNTDDLYSRKMIEGDAVRFYSHSKYLDMDKLIYEYKEFLNDIFYASIFDKMSFTFEYTEIIFSGSSQTIEEVNNNVRNIYIRANDGEPVEIIQGDMYGKTIKSLDIIDIETNTNLLAFNSDTYLGVLNMYEHMAMLYEQSDKLDWFEGFDNKATRDTAKLLSLELNEDKYGGTIEEDTYKLMDILEGTIDEKYLIGTSELFRYMKNVAPVILKHVMKNGGL